MQVKCLLKSVKKVRKELPVMLSAKNANSEMMILKDVSDIGICTTPEGEEYLVLFFDEDSISNN